MKLIEGVVVGALVLSSCSCATMRPASVESRIDKVGKKLESKRGLLVAGYTDTRGAYHELSANVWIEGDSLTFIAESKPMFKLEGPGSVIRFTVHRDSVQALHAEELTPGWMALRIAKITLLSLVLAALLRLGVWGVFGV